MSSIEYKEMPAMRPLPILTKNKGFIGAVWLWLMTSRQWQLSEDWYFSIHGVDYVIPSGFIFDGASIPKAFWAYLSPIGVLLMPGLVHDWVYKHQRLMLSSDHTSYSKTFNQKECDIMFRDLAIDINGFVVINHMAYYALRLFGFLAWNKHRKHDGSVN